MTIAEMITTTADYRDEATARSIAMTTKLRETKPSTAEEATALLELVQWRVAQECFNSALNALVQLDHLHDDYFGKKFEKVGGGQ